LLFIFQNYLYKTFQEWEIRLADDLRIKRNKSSYEGKQIERVYLENNKEKLISIINKLKGLIKEKLSENNHQI